MWKFVFIPFLPPILCSPKFFFTSWNLGQNSSWPDDDSSPFFYHVQKKILIVLASNETIILISLPSHPSSCYMLCTTYERLFVLYFYLVLGIFSIFNYVWLISSFFLLAFHQFLFPFLFLSVPFLYSTLPYHFYTTLLLTFLLFSVFFSRHSILDSLFTIHYFLHYPKVPLSTSVLIP